MSVMPDAFWAINLTTDDVHCWWQADGEPEHELDSACPCGPTGYAVAEHDSDAGGTIAAHNVYIHRATATGIPAVPVDLTAAIAL